MNDENKPPDWQKALVVIALIILLLLVCPFLIVGLKEAVRWSHNQGCAIFAPGSTCHWHQ